MKLVYLFPEALPLPRARGIQVAHTIVELTRQGIAVELVHAPGDGGDPFSACGLSAPQGCARTVIDRRLPWPLSRVQSNRVFFARLRRRLASLPARTVLMARHVKLAAMVLRAFPHLPLLYEAHEVFADTAAPKRRVRIERDEAYVMRWAAGIVTNSAATKSRLQERYADIGGPVAVIPNGVDLPDVPTDRDWSAPQQRVVYAGSFFGWKGVADLVQAAAALPGFTIRLIGGDAAQAAALTAAAPPSAAELIFAGRRPHGEVMAALAESCIAVLPNRPDTDSRFTSPIKLFEYMGAGCAVVASDLPSIREILADDEAEWFTPGDAASLAEALRRLAANPDRARAMGEHLRRKAEDFTWEARGRRLRQFLEQMTEGAGR